MNAWSYTSTTHYVFMAWCLIKHASYYQICVKAFSHITNSET